MQEVGKATARQWEGARRERQKHGKVQKENNNASEEIRMRTKRRQGYVMEAKDVNRERT